MDEAGKKRAGDYLAAHVGRMGWSAVRLAVEADLDPQTVRAFLEGERWPWADKRNAMERAAGLELGTLELVARGLGQDETKDPVVRAIEASPLNLGNRHALLSHYFTMLEQQQERGSA